MSWAKLDDQFFAHPKVIDLSKDAKILFLAGLCHCAAQLTDGKITPGALRMVCALVDVKKSEAASLVNVGLWHDSGDGSYTVHNYQEYNPSAEEVKAERAKNAARQAAWKARRKASNAAGNGVDNQGGDAPTPGDIDAPNAIYNTVSNGVTDGVNNGCPVPVPDPLGEGTVSTPIGAKPNLPAEAGNGDGGEGHAEGEAFELQPPSERLSATVERDGRWPWLCSVPREMALHADQFEAWYEAYPRKVGPTTAWAAWRKRVAPVWCEALKQRLYAAVAEQKRTEQWQKIEKIPHPATWLNDRRWENEDTAEDSAPVEVAPPSRPVEFSQIDPLADRLAARRARQAAAASSAGSAGSSGSGHAAAGRLPA